MTSNLLSESTGWLAKVPLEEGLTEAVNASFLCGSDLDKTGRLCLSGKFKRHSKLKLIFPNERTLHHCKVWFLLQVWVTAGDRGVTVGAAAASGPSVPSAASISRPGRPSLTAHGSSARVGNSTKTESQWENECHSTLSPRDVSDTRMFCKIFSKLLQPLFILVCAF